MVLSTPVAHLLCLGLIAVDNLTRAWRIQVLARGLHTRVRFLDAFTLNAASDATAALTPLRAGGEPVRFAGMVNAGLNVSDTIALISVEGIIEWLVVIVVGAFLGWRFGGEWWRTQQRSVGPHLRHVLSWILLIIVGGLVAWLLFRRFLPRVSVHVGGTLRDSLRLARRMRPWAVATTVPLTAIHIVARILVLPVVVGTLTSPPAFGAVLIGSFALLYGQNFVPTPSGAGAVDLGFINGVAGDVGPEASSLLLMWRFYTTLLGIILGIVFGVPLYAAKVRRFLLRRRDARRTVLRDDDAPG